MNDARSEESSVLPGRRPRNLASKDLRPDPHGKQEEAAADETLIRRFRELTADDFAEGLAVAVAEAERNRDEGTAE